MKFSTRPLSYIYNSRIDFIDAWLAILTIISGVILIVNDPLEIVPFYNTMIVNGVSSDRLGSFSVFIGVSNFIRILLPFKTNIILATVMKALSLIVYLILFITVCENPPLPLPTGFFLMVSLLSFDNLMRTK